MARMRNGSPLIFFFCDVGRRRMDGLAILPGWIYAFLHWHTIKAGFIGRETFTVS